MKRCLHEKRLCFAALLCLTITAHPAHAQSPFGRGPLTLSIGNFVPNSSGSHERSDQSAYSGTYTLSAARSTHQTLLFADYHQSASEGGERNRILGAGIAQKMYFRAPFQQSVSYFSRFGVGAYSIHGANAGAGLPARTQSATQAGLSVGAGLEVQRGVFGGFVLDIGYTFVPKRVAGVSESGLVVSTGIRF